MRYFVSLLAAGAVVVQLQTPKTLEIEKNPVLIQKKPGIAVVMRQNSLPPAFATVAKPEGFPLTDAYYFENAAQAIAPGANGQCSGGRIVLATGSDPLTMKLRTLAGDKATTSGTSQLPLSDKTEAGTDHQIVRMKNGDLMAFRTVTTWGPPPYPQPQPAWWNKVTIPGKPHGARGAIMAFRSSNCGNSWHYIGSIDPMTYDDGRFAVPRPTEANCPKGCVGGWDRVEAYADPYTGYIWVTANAAGGPIINYATGAVKEPAKGSNFVWVSMNEGRDFHSVLEFGAWTPMVITSTPNGRVYVFSHINTQPTLFYTLLSSQKIKFSGGKPINYVSNGTALPGAGDVAYGQFVYKATNAISRISTDAKSSKVRLAYQFVDSHGKTAIAIVRAEIPANDGDPVVTPIRTIHAATGRSTLAAAFVDTDPPSASNTAMLYWMEGSLDATVSSQARYTLFSSDGDFMPIGHLSGTWTPTGSAGHYLKGASFLGSGNKPSFVAQWAQPNAIYANVVTAAK